MNPTQPVLRGVIVKDDILKNRPYLWTNGPHFAPISVTGGTVVYLMSIALFKGLEFLCFNGSHDELLAKSITMGYDYEKISKIIPAIFAVLGLFATFGYALSRDSQIRRREHGAWEVIQNDDQIIDEIKYNQLQKIMGQNLSLDLNRRFHVPDTSESKKIVEYEENILNQMKAQILESATDSILISIYKGTRDQLKRDWPIETFLKLSLTKENVQKIFEFSKINNLIRLKYECIAFCRKRQIELAS